MSVFVVGSKNPVKVGAVQSIVGGLEAFAGFSVVGVAVPSGVSEQPLSLEETYRGAELRAQSALQDRPEATWGLGIEDGMYPCPADPARHLNMCVACVVGPEARQFGASSSFMYPEGVVRRVLQEGMDVSQALRAEGLTEHPKIGAHVGAIGLLSKGRLVREDYTKQAVLAALLPWL